MDTRRVDPEGDRKQSLIFRTRVFVLAYLLPCSAFALSSGVFKNSSRKETRPRERQSRPIGHRDSAPEGAFVCFV